MKGGEIRVEIADCLSPRPRKNRHRDKGIKAENAHARFVPSENNFHRFIFASVVNFFSGLKEQNAHRRCRRNRFTLARGRDATHALAKRLAG
jgi:hypothetical protein